MSKGAETDFDHWMQYAVRYFVLVSSGAAIATLSFMGASGKVPLMGALALLSFVVSIVVAGLVILGQLTAAWRQLLTLSGDDPRGVEHAVVARFITRLGDRTERKSGTYLGFAFGLFLLGATLGMATLLWVSISA